MTEEATRPWKPLLSVDLDGVINPYSRGWQDGELYEEQVTPGFWDWLGPVSEHFQVVVHSSRFADRGGAAAVSAWLDGCWERAGRPFPEAYGALTYSAVKPKAWIAIDDRCLRFDGRFDDPRLDPGWMRRFRPWWADVPGVDGSEVAGTGEPAPSAPGEA